MSLFKMTFISMQTILKFSFMVSNDTIHVTKCYSSSDIQSKKCEKCIFFNIFFNMDISMSITFMKIYLLIIDAMMEGTVSHIFEIT